MNIPPMRGFEAPGRLALELTERIAALHRLLANGDARARSGINALLAFGVRVSSAALLYLSQILIARWTGSYEYGIYVYAWTLVMLLGGFAHAGLNTAMIRLLPEYQERAEPEYARGLVNGGRWFTFVASCGIAAIASAVVCSSAVGVPSHYAVPLLLAFACIPAYAMTDLHDGLGRAHGWVAAGLMPPYLLRPLLLLVAVFAAISLGAGADASTVAAAAVAAATLTMLVQFALVERRLTRKLPRGPRRYAFRHWFQISIPLVVIGVSDMLLHHADVIVISLYLTPSDAGIYFAAAKTMSLMLYVHYAVGSAVANRFSALNAAGDKAGLESCVRDAVRWTFWPSLLAGGLVVLLGHPLLLLFGPQFTVGYPVMLILVLGFVIRGAFGPVEFMLNMLGEQRRCATVLVLAAGANIVLNLTLVPLWGILGAATATALALAGSAIANYLIACRHLRINCAVWSLSCAKSDHAVK